MSFMMWYDPSPKKVRLKVEDACRRYREKHDAAPTVLLCHADNADVAEFFRDDLTIHGVQFVGPNVFYVGVQSDLEGQTP